MAMFTHKKALLNFDLVFQKCWSCFIISMLIYHLKLKSRHGGVKFHKKMNFGLLFQKLSLGTQESFCKVWDQLDTLLNNYGLISSQSMLIIYHLKLKTAVSWKRLLGSQK